VDALESSFHAVRRGELDPRVGVALASMATAIARVFQIGELEQRMRDIEAAQEQQRTDGIAWRH
jgi:hypothetical protein